WRIIRLGDETLLQPADKLRADLKEIRRGAAVSGDKTAYQALPAGVIEQPAQHRKTAAEKALDVVEEQALVHGHALGGDARQQRLRLGLANARGEGQLVALAHRPASCCKARICATSAYSSLTGGKLKSR